MEDSGNMEAYEKLRKKYDLPPYDVLNSEFEISGLEKDFLLRNMIRYVIEKFEFYTKLIDTELLQPDTTLASLHESRFFTNGEKTKLYEIFMQLMHLQRGAVEAVLKRNEKDEAEYINNTLKEWQEIRKELLPFVTKLKTAWTNKQMISQEISYFG